MAGGYFVGWRPLVACRDDATPTAFTGGNPPASCRDAPVDTFGSPPASCRDSGVTPFTYDPLQAIPCRDVSVWIDENYIPRVDEFGRYRIFIL